jgi:TonB family protein
MIKPERDRALWLTTLLAFALALSSSIVGQTQDKPPCKAPKAVYAPDPVPPDSWTGKAPKKAEVELQITVDKKGKVHDPVVIRSAGKDADKSAIEAVRQWRFSPAMCGDQAIQTKVNVSVDIILL